MLFPTFEFFLFFTVVLFFNWTLKKYPLIWRVFLLTASYFFYSVWDFKFLLVLFAVSFINFFAALIIQKNFSGRKKLFLIFFLLIDTLFLLVFKYYDFFRFSLESLIRKAGFIVNFPLLEIILPIGLSFYILRAISYIIDVYKEKIKAEASWLDFFIYIAFFPHLLSGPIARASDFLGQLKNGGAKFIEEPFKNLSLIFFGFFKKVVISTFLTTHMVDDVLAVPENYAAQIVTIAVICYYLVIYFDFSGYSDMAIGFAGLLGFKSPLNFDFPYLSTNLRDFWRKWHISLSSWLRDYVYIPLGGNRRGELRKHINLFFSMVLVGLWHNSGLNFIFWGGLQGLGISISHLFLDKENNSSEVETNIFLKLKETINKIIWWFATFIFIAFSWIFFRSERIEDAFRILKTIFDNQAKEQSVSLYLLILIIFSFLFLFIEKPLLKYFTVFQEKMPKVIWVLFSILFMILLYGLSPFTIPPFIYFNF